MDKADAKLKIAELVAGIKTLITKKKELNEAQTKQSLLSRYQCTRVGYG